MSIVLCRHNRDDWYLCDRSYVNGKQRHMILEAYGKTKPTLYPPEIRSGLAEDILPKLPKESFEPVELSRGQK